MKFTRILLVLLIGSLALTACTLSTSTDDTAEDPEAAQSFFPNLDANGYNVTEADSVVDAITTAMSAASVGTGNLVLAGVIQKVDDMIECYQDVGAADAQIYTQRINITDISIPTAGVLAIINENRLADNFLHCLTRIPGSDLFQTQSAEPEPCWGYGSFTFNEETISFIFAATDQPLCDLFDANFAPYNPTGQTAPIFDPDGSNR